MSKNDERKSATASSKTSTDRMNAMSNPITHTNVLSSVSASYNKNVSGGGSSWQHHGIACVLVLMLAVLTALGAHARIALADTVTNRDGTQYSTTYVKQGADGNTFAANAPVATIYVNPNISTEAARNAATVTFLTGDPGFVVLPHGTEKNMVAYDTSQQGALATIKKNQDNYFEGNLFSFTYADAATLQDGSKADVVITYHDAHFAIQNNANESLKGARYLGSGTRIFVKSTIEDGVGNKSGTNDYSRYGLQVGVTIQVKQNGEVVPGTFFCPMADIDVVREGASFGGIYGAEASNCYSEQIRVDSGPVVDSDGYSIYVPDATGVSDSNDNNNLLGYKCEVEDVTAENTVVGTLFRPKYKDNLNADYGSVYSGFVAAVNNETGMNLTAWSAGSYTATVSSFLLAGKNSQGDPIVHNIVATRTCGGIIQTTEHGNQNGQLDDGSGKLGPSNPRTDSTVVVPDGKTVVYTMTPTDGYRVKEITVDGTTFNVADLGLSIGSSKKDISIDTGITDATLTNVDGKTYTFTFPRNNADHRIHVEYAADFHFKKEWVGGDATELTVTATPYTYSKSANHFVQAQSVSPITFTVSGTSQGVTDTTANSKTTWAIAYPSEGMTANGWNTAMPIEVPNTKSDDDLLYWFVTETVPSGYALQGYANANTTFTNFPEGDVRTTVSDIINTYADRAYMSFYEGEGGTISNVRRAEVTATKVWDDYDNGFGTRKATTFHVSATIGSTTYTDILPSRTVAANATGDGLSVVWGAGTQYSGTVTTGSGDDSATSHTAYATLEALQAAYPGLTFKKDENGITYTGSDGNTYYVNHLPAYDSSGQKIIYAITEDAVSGYTTTSGTATAGGDDTSQPLAYAQTYTNKLDQKTFTTNLTVAKLLEGEQAPANLFSFDLEAQDTKDNNGTVLVSKEKTPMPRATTVANGGNLVEHGRGSAVTFGPISFGYEDLLTYDTDGTTVTGVVTSRTFTYKVSEQNPTDSKYVKDSTEKIITITVHNNKDGKLTFTQTPVASSTSAEFNNSMQRFDLTATKNWSGGDDAEHTQVRLQLLKMVGGTTSNYLSTRTIQSSDEWKTTWENIPRYEQVNGVWEPVTYALSEEHINGYTTTYTSTASDTFKITSDTRASDWNTLAAAYPAGIQVQLLRNGVAYGESKTLSGENNWTAEWPSLPEMDENGTGVVYLYDYEVVAPTGLSTDSQAAYDALLAAWKPSVTEYDPTVNVTVTNTKQTITVNAQKEWVDSATTHNKRDAVTMTLERLNANDEVLVGGGTFTISAEDARNNTEKRFSNAWDDLAVATNGSSNIYRLSESVVPSNYTASIVAPTTTTIDLGITTSSDVVSTWRSRVDAQKPVFTVQLLRNGIAQGNPVTLNSKNEWAASWTSFPTMASDGCVYVYDYVVTNRPADWVFATSGFENQYGESTQTTGTGDGVSTTKLYDIHVRNTLLTDVTVAKKWVKESLQNVDVQLMRWTGSDTPSDNDYTNTTFENWEGLSGSAYRHTFAQSNNYTGTGDDRTTYDTYTFTKLPAFDENGNPYYYRVKELTTGPYFTTTYNHNTTGGEVHEVVNTSTFQATGQALVGVIKNLDGRAWQSGDEYTFTISPTDSNSNAPLPHKATSTGEKDTSVAADSPTVTIGSSSASVGDTGRFAYFDPIFLGTSTTSTDETYTYKIKETAGTQGGMAYSTAIATVKIKFKAEGTNVTSSVEYVNLPAGATFPTFTNTYDVQQDVQFTIAKRIRDYTPKSGDVFVFTITPVGDAPEPKASTTKIDYTTGETLTDFTKTTNGSSSPTIPVKLSDLKQTDDATGLAWDNFVYEVRESHGINTSFSYDVDPVYVKLTVKDKGDGTLDSSADYYTDPTCRTRVPVADRSAATFENSVVRNISVTKEWHGPVMCDTTLQVERQYADGSWGVATLTNGESNPFTLLRSRFVTLGVTKDTNGKEVRSITHTFHGLPKYDAEGNVITYRVVETSPEADDGFAITYSSTSGNETKTDGTVTDSDSVTITNTYDHETKAQVAVVKELLGRTWLDPSVDTYDFVLTAVRNGTSAADDDLKAMPMPGGKHGSDGLNTLASSEALGTPARNTGSKVSYADEYLAMFAPITFNVSDLTYNSNTGKMEGDFYYTLQEVKKDSTARDPQLIGSSERYVLKGVTYAAGEVHSVHIRVTDDMRGNVVSRVFYDEDELGLGTMYTPVITNHYDATGTGTANIVKYLLGTGNRVWTKEDSFTFKMRPVGNAPWRYPSTATTTGNNALSITLNGTADSDSTNPVNYRTIPTPELTFRLSDLTHTASADGKDEDGNDLFYAADGGHVPVPAGLKYDSFLYAITETGGSDSELIYDEDDEYVRFTVIDKGDGTLDVRAEYFADMDDTEERAFESAEVTGAPFTNIEKKDITVTKVWDGVPNSDAFVSLRKAELSDADLAGADANSESRTFGNIWRALDSDKAQAITQAEAPEAGKVLVGYDGKFFSVSQGSAVTSFATGSGTQYFEVPSGYSIVRIAEDYYKLPDGYYPAQVNGTTYYVPYALNDGSQLWSAVDSHTFTTSEFTRGSESTTTFEGLPLQVQRTENNVIVTKHVVYYVYEIPNASLYSTTYAATSEGSVHEGSVATRSFTITNKSAYGTNGSATVGVAKNLQGRDWKANVYGNEDELLQQEDEFEFVLTPKGRATYDKQGVETSDVLATDIPMPAGFTTKASTQVSESNEAPLASTRRSSFDAISISLSDLTHAADGTWKGDFYYTLSESIGDDYVALEEVTDAAELNYHSINGVKYKQVTDTSGASVTWGNATDEQKSTYTYWLDTERSISFSTVKWDVRIHALDVGNGTISTSVTYKSEDSPNSDYVTTTPTYTNYYDASGVDYSAFIKHIAGRDWSESASATSDESGATILAGDAFRFSVQQVGGAIMRPTAGSTDSNFTILSGGNSAQDTQENGFGGNIIDDNEWMTPAVTAASPSMPGENNRTDHVIRSGEGMYHLSDLAYNSETNQYERAFVHTISEYESFTKDDVVKWPKVDYLAYDQSIIYMQTIVWDKGDGTLGTWHRYFTDATCKNEITGHEVWVDEDGYPFADQSATSSWTATETEVTACGLTFKVPTYTDSEGKTYTRVNAAYFFNSRTVDVPVAKKWVGMPVEDVTIHLQRALVPADTLPSGITDEYVVGVEGDDTKNGFADAGTQGTSNFETWRAVGHVTTLQRGDFLKDDGTPKYDEDGGNTVTRVYKDDDAIDGFNKDLPMFVVNDGKIGKEGDSVGTLYRAIYRVVEDDTSDTYVPTYTIEGVEGRTTNYFVEEGTLTVTNTTTATNTASITAAKQLVDRNWNSSDAFRYFLTPLGKGTYYKQGDTIPTGSQVGDLKVDEANKAVLDAYSTSNQNVPLPAAAVVVPGYNDESGGKSLDAWCAVATTATAPLGEGEHLARFGAITYDTSMLEMNPTGRHLQGDFYYSMREYVPEEAVAVQKTPDSDDVLRKPVTFTNGIEDANGTTLTWQDASKITGFSMSDYYWKLPEENENYDGIIYDASVHIVHVQVRENRTDQLQVVVAYDETDQADVSTGSQFTPVFTNHYEAAGHTSNNVEDNTAVRVWKQKLGTSWTVGNSYDFTMQPVGGAVFTDYDHEADFAEGDTKNGVHNATPSDGKAVHTTENQHLIRLTISQDDADHANAQTDWHERAIMRVFPRLAFTQDDLNLMVSVNNTDESLVTDNNAVKYSDGSRVRAGVKYGRFVYLVREVQGTESNIIYDTDREYVRITAVDLENGKIDLVVEYYEDNACTIKRMRSYVKQGETVAEPFPGTPFTNLGTHSVYVQKDWEGYADETVTVHLKQVAIKDDEDGTSFIIVSKALAENFTPSEGNAVLKVQTGLAQSGDGTTEPVYTYCEVVTGNASGIATSGGVATGVSLVSIGTNGSTKRYLVTDDQWVDTGKSVTFDNDEFSTRMSTVTKEIDGLPSRDGITKEDGHIEYHTYIYRIEEDPSQRTGFTTVYPHQVTSGLSSEDEYGTQNNPLEVKNKSMYDASSAPVVLGVAKSIEGRAWSRGGDYDDSTVMFKMRLEAEGTTPMPEGYATKGDKRVIDANTTVEIIANSRYRADFKGSSTDVSKQGIVITHDDIDPGNTGVLEADFTYTLCEVIPAGAQATIDNVVYTYEDATKNDSAVKDKVKTATWVYRGVTYSTDTYTAVVHAVDHGNGTITTTVTYTNEDGGNINGLVPTYTNTYDAHGSTQVHITKFMDGREFLSDDEFGFRITPLGGTNESSTSITKDKGGRDGNVWYTPVMYDGNPTTQIFGSDTGDNNKSNHARSMVAQTINYKLSDLPIAADGTHEGYFVYELEEIDPKVDTDKNKIGVKAIADVQYDSKTIYLKVTVSDNGDGTLSTSNEYFTDPDCTTPVQVPVTADQRDAYVRPVVTLNNGVITGIVDYDATTHTPETKGASWEFAANFENCYATDITVTKKWDGPVVSDVTLVLERARAQVDSSGNVTVPTDPTAWQRLSDTIVTLTRQDFTIIPSTDSDSDWAKMSEDDKNALYFIDLNGVKQTYDSYAGADKDTRAWTRASVSRTFKDLPLTVEADRYVYRVVETTANDAYKTESIELYRTVNGERILKSGANATIITGDVEGATYEFEITNKAQATNVANLSAVKQLMGREWTDEEYFTFTLAPQGKAEYDSNGNIKTDDTGVVYATTTAPMPTSHVSTRKVSNDAGAADIIGDNQALAAKTTESDDAANGTEEIVGVGERLARFGGITYKLADLTEVNGSYQGDFFYTMQEELPADVSVDSYNYTDGTSSSTQDTSKTLASVTLSDSLTYDMTVHTVHVEVRANSTQNLSTTVYYDQTDYNNAATGRLYTPVFTNTYASPKTDVRATKVWIDGNNVNNMRQDVQLTLAATAGDTDVTESVLTEAGYTADDATKTIAHDAEGDDLKVEWKQLATHVDNEKVEYTITENTIDGYTASIEKAVGGDAIDLTVTNTLSGTTKVEGTKQWVDGGKLHDNAHEVTLQLWRKSAKGGTTPEILANVPTWDGDDWRFAELAAYDGEGYEYGYYVVERSVMGYDTEYANTDTTVVDRALDGATITNTISSDLVSFTATKAWDDNNNNEGLRKNVVLHLEYKVGDGEWVRMSADNDRVIEYSEGGAMVAEWDSLPRSHENDTIDYRVVEEPMDGYTAEVRRVDENDLSKGFIVTNTHEANTVTVQATKHWVDDNNADHLRPDHVTLHLIASTGDGWRKDMGTAEARSDSNWKATWSNLLTHHDGDEITYSVVEEAVPGYYVSASSEVKATANDVEIELTNTRTTPVTEVTATKAWDDNNNQDGKRQDIKLRLEARAADGTWAIAKDKDGNAVEEKLIAADASDADRTVTWGNLPVTTTALGHSLMTQSSSENTETPSDDAETDSQVFNNNADEDQTQDAQNANEQGKQEGEEVWTEQGTNDVQPSAVESDGSVSISNADTGPEGTDGSVQQGEGGAIGNTLANRIMSLFTLRKAYAEESTLVPVAYRVVELVQVDGGWVIMTSENSNDYVAVVSQTANDSFMVTNVHQPETRSFTVRKAWDTSRNSEAVQLPSSIQVQLLVNGEAQGDPAELMGDDWIYTWNDLPKYREGNELVYTVEELNVPEGYTSTGEASDTDYVITNIYNGTITVTATKQWVDENGATIAPGTGTETPEVTMQLLKNGVAVGDPKTIPSAANATSEQMQVSWSDLASWENNERVSYTVEETVGELDGYVTRQSGFSNTIAQDGAVEFVNELKPFYSTGDPDDPDRVIKVTYVDHLLAEDGNGGSLTHDKDLVLVFKTRLADLDTTALNNVGATPTKGQVYAEGVDDEPLAEAATTSPTVPGDTDSDSHEGWTFTGWTINRDQFGDYIMVAHHSKNTHTTYVDGQTGQTWDSEPTAPSHDGLRFVGWKQVTDAAGNTIFVAQYESVDTGSTSRLSATQPISTAAGTFASVSAKPLARTSTYESAAPLARTGETNILTTLASIFVAAGVSLVLAFVLKREERA